MKKIVLLISFLLLSGCTVNYDLSYFDNIYSEKSNVLLQENELCGEEFCNYYVNSFYNNNISIDINDDEEELAEGVNLDKYIFYNKKLLDNGMELNYNFTNRISYSHSKVIHYLFNNVKVNSSGIIANEINNIFETYRDLDEIVITFSTDKIISSTNSDKIINNKYYWYINKDNYLNKDIKIVFDKEANKNTEIITEDKYITWNGFKYILYILLIFILIAIIVIYEKVRNSNK